MAERQTDEFGQNLTTYRDVLTRMAPDLAEGVVTMDVRHVERPDWIDEA